MACAALCADASASRIKDLTVIEGGRENQLVGYGIVVGLAGKGDSQLNFTVQSIANALQRFGVNVPASALKSNNVAAVIVTGQFNWVVMLVLVTLMGVDHPPIADDGRPLGALRTALGLAVLAIPVLTFMPEPMRLE